MSGLAVSRTVATDSKRRNHDFWCTRRHYSCGQRGLSHCALTEMPVSLFKELKRSLQVTGIFPYDNRGRLSSNRSPMKLCWFQTPKQGFWLL